MSEHLIYPLLTHATITLLGSNEISGHSTAVIDLFNAPLLVTLYLWLFYCVRYWSGFMIAPFLYYLSPNVIRFENFFIIELHITVCFVLLKTLYSMF